MIDGFASFCLPGITTPGTPKDFLEDIEIIRAFHFSEMRDGAPVRIPLHERSEQRRLLVSRKFLDEQAV